MADRKEYHRKYYQNKKNMVERSVKKVEHNFQHYIGYVFIFVSTLFLIAETSSFYESYDTQIVPPMFKAILAESMLIIIAIVFRKSRTTSILLAICIGLSAYTFSANVVKLYLSEKVNNKRRDEVLEQIADKRKIFDMYVEKSWPRAAGRVEIELNELLKLSNQLLNTQKTNITDLIVLLVFRVMIQVTNIGLVRRKIYDG